MTEKTYKNVNKIRTEHFVGRVIIFEDKTERGRFLLLYGDLIHKYIICDDSPCWDYIGLYITMKKELFNDVVNELGLVNVSKDYCKTRKTRFWKMNKVLV